MPPGEVHEEHAHELRVVLTQLQPHVVEQKPRLLKKPPRGSRPSSVSYTQSRPQRKPQGVVESPKQLLRLYKPPPAPLYIPYFTAAETPVDKLLSGGAKTSVMTPGATEA